MRVRRLERCKVRRVKGSDRDTLAGHEDKYRFSGSKIAYQEGKMCQAVNRLFECVKLRREEIYLWSCFVELCKSFR